jgi:hypothetical protein
VGKFVNDARVSRVEMVHGQQSCRGSPVGFIRDIDIIIIAFACPSKNNGDMTKNSVFVVRENLMQILSDMAGVVRNKRDALRCGTQVVILCIIRVVACHCETIDVMDRPLDRPW